MGAHALLSASSAHRWIHCSPSARLEETFENTTSVFAEEGTFIHELGELKLSNYIGLIKESDYKKKLKEMHSSKFFNSEIQEAIETYVTFAIELIEATKQKCKDPIILLEQRLDFSKYVEGGFGTGDLIIVADGTLEIVDLKGGKGVAVSAECNPQMQLYALGAMILFDCLYDIQTVRMTICQTRMDNISTYELSVEELIAWAEEVLKPAAQLAWNGEGEFYPRDYTCKFCKAKATCRARVEKNLEIAKYEFRQASLLTKDEITEILPQVDTISAWCKDLWTWVEARAIDGEKFKGFKIVEGRSNRTYSDEKAVIEKLTEAGYSEDEVFIKNLKGITALEKVLGKKVFSEILDGMITKPRGKFTMVADSDKRQAIQMNNTAEADFKEEI
jgi:transcription elongation factor Elf1